ncbi:MAG TPA: L,D-transpeptidase [Thermoanaerobaculia bacterium]|jgi:lipoprotein-anchoring transpeptidase ErfK/SrfK|nr:L,D-transpeptidase [Thermoanaerobaculia bacterium]
MNAKLPILILPLLLGACTYEDATDEQPTETPAAQTSQNQSQQGYSVPIGEAEYDTSALEQGRLDPAWRQYAERDRLERLGTTPAPAPQGQSPLTTGAEPAPPTGSEGVATPKRAASESYEQISPEALSGNPALPLGQEGGGPSILRTQILLDRARFSPGVIDGNWGKNTAKAVYWFQFAKGLNTTGEVDRATWDALARAAGAGEPLSRVQATAEDLKGPFVDPLPHDPYEQAKLECLCYSSPLELFAERGHATPELIQKLNPQVDFANLQAGTEIVLPNVPQMSPEDVSSKGGAKATPAANRPGAQAAPAAGAAGGQVARILISKQGFYLQGLDAQGHILYHFPSTLGSKYDPSATGTLQITGIHPEPGFHYQPKLFADVSDEKPEAQLPSGPNSPVGLVWLDLSKPHHGIHGTASPETIGYTSSHGCVRLTNWDALFLAQHVNPGTQVVFRE